MSETRQQPTLIGGNWVGATEGRWFEDLDPADTRRTIALLPRLAPEQVSTAIDHAHSSAPEWAGTSPIDRGRVLLEAAQLIRQRVDQIAGDVCVEAGKLLAEARGEVMKSADFLEYYAGFGRGPQGAVLPDERIATFTHTLVEPLGVVVLITAWNDPILTPARKIGPALISGNSVVIKPAEDTPLAAIHLARALVDAGLPSSAMNVVVGYPDDVAAPLLDHPDVRAVSFTGSTRTAETIRTRLSGRNVRFQAETGGKNAAAVLSGANVGAAADVIAGAAFAQAGQRCTATSRVVADETIAEELTELLANRSAGIRVGAGYDEASQMGPLINKTRVGEVERAIRAGVASGDSIVHGGNLVREPRLEHGCFIEPTVISVADPDSNLWREEVFGPVLSIMRVHGVDAAIASVNDSSYGLSAAVFTEDLGPAMEFARRVDTGQVAVNRPTSGWDVHLPFGGFKDSGSLSKEQGSSGIDFYTKLKTIAVGYAG
jgi:acyl-CoA reductase-like NAD-dependent aldehyde dehydrogenase